MQSASETPSSHLWVLSCPADQRGVGHGSARRANPGTKAVAERSHFGDLDVPKCITSTATLRGVFLHHQWSQVHARWRAVQKSTGFNGTVRRRRESVLCIGQPHCLS